MSFIFSTAQLTEIQRLFGIAEQRNTNGNVSNYADVYAYIRDQLNFMTDPIVNNVARWFTAATDANAGIGAVSELIRCYTQQQCDLRGVAVTSTMMQLASNAVAKNVVKSIIDNKAILNHFIYIILLGN
jgi:hypothetical protein